MVSSLLRSLPATGFSLQFFPSDTSRSNHTGTVLHASHSLWPPWLSTSLWTSPNLVKIQLRHHNASQLSLSLALRRYTRAQPQPIPPTLLRSISGISISRCLVPRLKKKKKNLQVHLYQFILYNCLSPSQEAEAFLEAEAFIFCISSAWHGTWHVKKQAYIPPLVLTLKKTVHSHPEIV